jgi:predicted enzyme related to lactoylglutathione lyase
MKRASFLSLAAFGLIAAAPPPASHMPAYSTDPAQLPKVFAIAIRAKDQARSIRFYREGMGAVGETPINDHETIVNFRSGVSINVVKAAPDFVAGEGALGFVFQTADLDTLVARVPAAGGTIIRPASDGKATGGVRVAFVRDPDGTRIECIQFPQK